MDNYRQTPVRRGLLLTHPIAIEIAARRRAEELRTTARMPAVTARWWRSLSLASLVAASAVVGSTIAIALAWLATGGLP